MKKFTEKAQIMERLHLLEDPQCQFQLLRCCITPRTGFWLRTMAECRARRMGAACWSMEPSDDGFSSRAAR